MRVSGLGNWKKDEFGVESIVFFYTFFKKKTKKEMNEVGFRFHELSLGQVKALDCGNSLGPILAKNSRKTGEKSRFFPWAGVENPPVPVPKRFGFRFAVRFGSFLKVGQLAGGWLAGRLVGQLVGRLVGRPAGWPLRRRCSSRLKAPPR